MPDTAEARARTHAFARVIGPFLVIVPGIVALRFPGGGSVLTDFFENSAIVWVTGAILLFGGLLIIGLHRNWSGLSAVLISLFGWFLALRGVALLAAPQLIHEGATASRDLTVAVQTGFGVLVLIGLWLTYVGWVARAPGSDRDRRGSTRR
jgi:hypothetical protein